LKNLDIIKSKIYTDIKYQSDIWKSENKKIVFTNGCFDILHRGHVEYLSAAKDLGDILIIGMNSDDSPYWLTKGPNRPINNQDARSLILASLLFVDAVVYFSDETPLNLIESIIPDILVKGKDYREEDIIGYDFVKSNGGEILTIDMVDGYSTTNIIKKSQDNIYQELK
jgi:rfaE bifunctional protein nucleotidyltransferase chain/domain